MVGNDSPTLKDLDLVTSPYFFKAQAKSRPLLYLAGNTERDSREVGSPSASVSSFWLVLSLGLLLHNRHSEGPRRVCGHPKRRWKI